MLELGREEQADKPMTKQVAVVKRIRLKDLINAEMFFMECFGWV